MPKKTKDEIRQELSREAEWKTRTPGIACGTYVMRDNTPNHDALIDRRQNTDWRVKEDLPAGEYIVEDYTHIPRDHDTRYAGPPYLRMWRVQNNGTLYDVPCYDARFWMVLEHAELVQETPSRWLTATRNENWSLEILDQLVKYNQVSLQAVKTAYKSAVAEYERMEEFKQLEAEELDADRHNLNAGVQDAR